MGVKTDASHDRQTARVESEVINYFDERLFYRMTDEQYGALSELYSLYNSSLGPVQKVVSYFGPPSNLRLYVGHCQYYDFDRIFRRLMLRPSLKPAIGASLFAGGKGASLPEMLAASVGELVERVVGVMACVELAGQSILGSYKDLTGDGLECVAPEALPLFAEEQFREPGFRFEPFHAATKLSWLEGKRLVSGKSVWVPAQLVMLLPLFRTGEALIGYATSGGLSCHVSRQAAIYHGILELIERDALNVRWHSRIPPPELDWIAYCASDRQLRRILAHARQLPGKLRLHYQTLDINAVAVVSAVRVDRWLRRFSYYSGAGADLDAEAATLKALKEFAQADTPIRLALLAPDWHSSRAIHEMFSVQPDTPPEEFDLFIKVVSYYGHEDNRKRLDWLYEACDRSVTFASLDTRSLPGMTIKEKLEVLQAALASRGIDPIVFDLTPQQFRQLSLIKVFIPELTQPFIQHTPYFGHPRFYDLPAELGYSERTLTYDDLSKDPTPYP